MSMKLAVLLLLTGGKPVGIVTERDMLKRIIHELREPEKTSVIDITSKPLTAAAPKMSAGDAAKLMLSEKLRNFQ